MVRDPEWLTRGARHVWRPYCQHATASPPLAVVGARGSRLHLADGRELVDAIASWWTVAHGYGAQPIVDAIAKQLTTLPHVAFGGLAHESAYSLAERLATMLPQPLSRVFFVESGSVAVEVALKMALQSFHNRGDHARRTIVCFENAYHGDTFATMALGDPFDGMHRAFRGAGVRTVHLPLPTADDDLAFERAVAALADEIAAIVVEPLLQCAGGMRVHDRSALERMRAACDRHGALLVFDEIATGFFRTGTPFALDRAGVIPDIVTLGKALTGGFLPLACTVATDAVFDSFLSPDGTLALAHGPTYMANALACAAAHASLDLFAAEAMPPRIEALQRRLLDGLAPLREHANVRDVRVFGAMGAVEMEPGTAPASEAFVARGAFVRPLRLRNADVVYTMPPLSINEEDTAVLLAALRGALAPGQ